MNKENPKYLNKIVAPTMDPVRSIGGFLMYQFNKHGFCELFK